MPLYMAVHNHIDGLTADAVARVHQADVKTQSKYGVKYLRSWFDLRIGKVFCLIEAPDEEVVAAALRETRGPLADELIEVKETG